MFWFSQDHGWLGLGVFAKWVPDGTLCAVTPTRWGWLAAWLSGYSIVKLLGTNCIIIANQSIFFLSCFLHLAPGDRSYLCGLSFISIAANRLSFDLQFFLASPYSSIGVYSVHARFRSGGGGDVTYVVFSWCYPIIAQNCS